MHRYTICQSTISPDWFSVYADGWKCVCTFYDERAEYLARLLVNILTDMDKLAQRTPAQVQADDRAEAAQREAVEADSTYEAFEPYIASAM